MFKFASFKLKQRQIELVYPDDDYAAGLYDQVAVNRAQLSRWLPWAKVMKSVVDEAAFLEHARLQIAKNKLVLVVILVDGQPAGMLDLHEISSTDHRGEIGYWLGQQFQGQGIMTVSLTKFVQELFNQGHLHKISLLAAVGNAKSCAVAERVGFHLSGTLRDHILIDGVYNDAKVFETIAPAK